MKFKMIMLVMALSAVCMTACGKAEEKKVESAAPESSEIQGESGNAEVESMAPGSYEIQDEGGAFTESDDSFGQVSIGAYKLGTMIKVSEELLNDSVFDLENYIAREFARRIGNKEEDRKSVV